MTVLTQPHESSEMYEMIKERDEAVAALERSQVGVSVCIPTYNDSEHIYLALESAIYQTVPPLEVLIIDDGSTVPVKLENSLYNLGVEVEVIRVTNRGLPAARNVGLMHAKGMAFLPLDADDWIEETYIEKTYPLLDYADVVLTGLQEHGPTRNGTYMPGYDRPFQDVDEEILWQYNRFFYCSLFRTQVLRDVGGYNPRMAGGWGVSGGYEDWDLWIDLKRRNARFVGVNEALFHYTTKPESMLTAAERNRDVLVSEMKRHHQR